MEMRIRLWKERKIRKDGTLVCSKCRSGGHYALYEGGLCRRCHKPERIDFVPRPVNAAPKYAKEQLPETIALKARVDRALETLETNRHAFARRIGLCPGRLSGWYHGHLAETGQRNINAVIEQAVQALDEKFQSLESGMPA